MPPTPTPTFDERIAAAAAAMWEPVIIVGIVLIAVEWGLEQCQDFLGRKRVRSWQSVLAVGYLLAMLGLFALRL